MLRHNQQLEALQEMVTAYTDMRRRLDRINIDHGLERSRRRIDCDLECFRFKIAHLSLTLGRRPAPIRAAP